MPPRLALLTAALALVLGACGKDAAAPGAPPAGSARFISFGIATAPPNTLVHGAIAMEVRDARAIPAARLAVQATVLDPPTPLPVGAIGPRLSLSGVLTKSGTWTTDARGAFAIDLATGQYGGNYRIELRADRLKLVDTVNVRVLCGGASYIRRDTRDSSLTIGATVALNGSLRDYAGVACDDSVSYAALTPTLRVSQNGTVTAASLGDGAIEMRGGGIVDTVRLSVVPSYEVAFVTALGVELRRLDGSNRRPLVQLPTDSPFPFGFTAGVDWLADGRLVVTSRSATNDGLLLIAPDGSSSRLPVPPGMLRAYAPRVTVDKQWIFFAAEGPTARNATVHPSVWRMRPDGSDATLLAESDDSESFSFDAPPAPSPNGDRFVVIGFRVYATGNPDPAPARIAGISPIWSPDGTRIAMMSGSRVIAARPDGSAITLLSTRPARPNATPPLIGPLAAWSPDGQWIVALTAGDDAPPMLLNVATGDVIPLHWARGLVAMALR